MMDTPTGADVQLENGFLRIHPAILEALAQSKLTGQELRAVLFLLRQTYGWQKKEDAIGLTQWMRGLGLTHRHHVLPVLESLLAKKVIYRNGADPVSHAHIYGFNKYFEEWQTEPVTPQGNTQSVMSQGNTPVTLQRNTPVTPQGNRGVTPQRNPLKIKKDISKDKPKDKPTTAPSAQQALFGAIAAVCQLDPQLKAGMIGKQAAALLKAGYSAADVLGFAAWWQSDAWRKQHRPVPSLADLLEKLPQAQAWRKRSNGCAPKTDENDWHLDPEIVAIRRERGEIS